MEWVETTGSTVEAARDAALDELGVDERDAELVVVAEPRSGLFGFGRVEARVRARVRPAPPRPKRTQRRRGDDRGRGRSSGRKNETGDKTTETSGTAGSPRRRRSRGRQEAPSDSDERVSGAGDGLAAAPAPPDRRSGRKTRATGARAGSGEEAGQRPDAGSEEAGMTIEEQAEAVERFVSGVVDRFGFEDASTAVRVEDDYVFVDVTGEELGLLIGPRGRTLDALQELARTVLQRRGEEGGTRVVVDVAGFRAKRATALEAFTRRVVAEVVAQDAPQALEAMSSADRKIVHDTATKIGGVHTSSEGVDPHRYVVIHPGVAPSAAADAADA